MFSSFTRTHESHFCQVRSQVFFEKTERKLVNECSLPFILARPYLVAMNEHLYIHVVCIHVQSESVCTWVRAESRGLARFKPRG